MVLTRRQEAAQQGLYRGLCSRDADAVLRALASLGGLPPLSGGCSPLHLAAATDCVGALAALAAAGGRGALDAPLGRLLLYEWPDWMDQLWGEALSHEQRMALGLPGCTPLAVACRCARRLAAPNASHRMLLSGPGPWRPQHSPCRALTLAPLSRAPPAGWATCRRCVRCWRWAPRPARWETPWMACPSPTRRCRPRC